MTASARLTFLAAARQLAAETLAAVVPPPPPAAGSAAAPADAAGGGAAGACGRCGWGRPSRRLVRSLAAAAAWVAAAAG